MKSMAAFGPGWHPSDLARVAEEVPASDLPAIVGALAQAQAVALARLTTPRAPTPVADGDAAESDEFLTTEQAAQVLKVSANYVETLARQGKLPHVVLPATDLGGRARKGRLVRIRRADLFAFGRSSRA